MKSPARAPRPLAARLRRSEIQQSHTSEAPRPQGSAESPLKPFVHSRKRMAALPGPVGLRVVCMGAGYVGGPTMAVLAARCPDVDVCVVDAWAARIEAWNGSEGSELPIYEPGLAPLVASGRARGNLRFVTGAAAIDAELRRADIIFVAVNTPTKAFGAGAGFASDVRNVELAARQIAAACRGGAARDVVVVEKSTVPVRTAETLRAVLGANAGAGSAGAADGAEPAPPGPGPTFAVLSSPEFLAEGSAVEDLTNPARVLIGAEDSPAGARAARTLAALYERWVSPSRILTTNLWSSELSKLVANAFLAQRISSVNAVSALCEASGADVDEVARAVGADPRVGPHFLKAGCGFGGSCFKKDVLNLVYICRSYGLHVAADYWQQVVDLSEPALRQPPGSAVACAHAPR